MHGGLGEVTKAERRNSKRDDVAYTRLPGHERATSRDVDKNSFCGKIVTAIWFQNVMGLVIMGNAAALGLETEHAKWPYWDQVELGFLVVFSIELLMKICVDRLNFFRPMHDDFAWNLFDSFIIGLGWFDASAELLLGGNGTGGFATIFRLFRLLRILRIFRLLKFLSRLYILAMGLIEAAKAIFWVTILMGGVLYVCALVLVKTVGRPPHRDDHYDFMDNHFGTIYESMITLFVLMSSPNLPIYQEEVGLLDQHPCLTMFLIAFITFGSFGMIAMLTGVINESMFENNEMQKQSKRQVHEEMRASLGERSADLFESLHADDEGEVTIDEVKTVAHELMVLVEATGAHFAQGDILKLIENMDIDDSGTLSITEFVRAVEKISEGASPMAVLEVHRDVGQVLRRLSVVDDRTLNMFNELRTIGRSVERFGERDSTAESFQKDMVKHMLEMKSCISMVSEQIGDVDKRLQYAVGDQVGEIGKSVQRLLDTKVDSGANRLQFAFGQQIEEIQRSVQRLLDDKDGGRDTRLGSAIERIERSVASQQAEMRQVTEIQKSIDRLVEQDASDRSRQMDSAGKMELIASSVQKILTTTDGRDAQNFQGMEDIRTSMQRLFEQVQKSSDARVEELQRQVDAAQANLLGGVAELGGVMLAGVGDLLSKQALQAAECSSSRQSTSRAVHAENPSAFTKEAG